MIRKIIVVAFMLFIVGLGAVFGAVQIKYTNGSCGCEVSYSLYESTLFDKKDTNKIEVNNKRFGNVKNKDIKFQPAGTTFDKRCYLVYK